MSIVWKFAIWSGLLIILVAYGLATAAWNNQRSFSGGTPSFQYWQNEYKTVAYQFADTKDTRNAISSLDVDVVQYTIQKFPFIESDGTEQQRVDRCESCHIGVDNPNMTAENIIWAVDRVKVSAAQVPQYLTEHPKMRDLVFTIGCHPGKSKAVTQGMLDWGVATNTAGVASDVAKQKLDAQLMQAHPFATYGCTTCHDGSGRELVQNRAHGNDPFWLQPMLPRKYQDAACAQCHEKFDPKTFAAVYLPEMTTIARGEQLFKQNACWGCHKIEGFSKGNVGPELTIEGRIEPYYEIEHQLWDPRYKVNGCIMPYFFSDRVLVGPNGEKYVMTPLGKEEPASSVVWADVPDETRQSLDERDEGIPGDAGYIPDAANQAKVDALVTFVISQTGFNYSQSLSARIQRLSAYDKANPPTVPVTAAEGKLVFEQSGCYACHYLGDPNDVQNGHGGIAGPNLSWEGARHSRQWVVAHYQNPQAFVPKSIMPIFPFSDSQRAALALWDTSFLPKGAKPVSPDQDMPTAAMIKDDITVPQVRYMTR